MRLAKLALFGIVVAALIVAWGRRDFVVSAYTDEPESIDVQLQGIRAFDAGDSGPSPYSLAFVESNDVVTPALAQPPRSVEPVAVVGGRATIRGVVVDPAGFAVPDAFVRIERITSDGSASVDVLSDEAGGFILDQVLGGRYRVRAFVPNQQRSVDVDVFVLAAAENKVLDLTVVASEERVVLDLVTGDSIVLGPNGEPGRTTVAVTAGREVVDVDGLVVIVPLVGVPIELTMLGPAAVLSESVVASDVGGAARFLIECRAPGQHTVDALAADVRRAFTLPPCVVPEPVAPVEPATDPATEPEAGTGERRG